MAELSFVCYFPPGSDGPVLVPSTTHDKNTIQKLRWKHGDVIASEFRRPRSGKFHRMVWGALAFIFSAQERFDNIEALRRWLTIQTSFVTVAIDHASGKALRIPKSWSYAELDEIAFEQLYFEVEKVALMRFFPTETENWFRAGMNYSAFMDGLAAFHDEEQRRAFKNNQKADDQPGDAAERQYGYKGENPSQ